MEQQAGKIRDAAFTGDHQFAVTMNEKGFIVWDARDLSRLHTVTEAELGSSPIMWLMTPVPHESRLILCARHKLMCYDVQQNQVVWQVKMPDLHLLEVCRLSPDGRLIYTCQRAGGVRVWDAVDGSAVDLLQNRAGSIASCAISPDGQTIAIADFFGRIELIDPKFGMSRLTLSCSRPRIVSVEFSPNGKQLAAVTRGGVDIWSIETP